MRQTAIAINLERCTGCGACVEICPTAALYLVDGKAAVDNTLCHECQACLDACANQAIALALQPKPAAETVRLPAQRPEPEIIRVKTQTAPVPLRARILPLVGPALAWAGREIVPRVVDVLLDALDRRAYGKEITTSGPNSGAPPRGTEGRKHQHRHRHRGGR